MNAIASPAVFLSYASQDAEAVARLAEALRAAGVEVWFDKDELVGGDAWDQKIRRQIKGCALFVPVISANTQARGEGYFRLEWKLAVDRSHLMAPDQPFLLPVVIDDTPDAAARVADEFRAVQWTRLPGGERPEKFCARVRALLGGETVSGTREHFAGTVTGVETPARSATKKSPRLVPAILAVAAVFALALWRLWRGNETPAIVAPPPVAQAATVISAAPAVSEKSLVVLPFENLSPDPENAFFTEGMHAEIISTLSLNTDLKVIPRSASLAFKGSAEPMAEIAQKLGVANVMTGNVRRSGNAVRIQLELRRARDEALLWSSPKGDRELKDALSLQSEIAEQVARVFQARAERGKDAGARFLTTNPHAFDLYLKASALYQAGTQNLAQIEECMVMMEEALRLDPAFMPGARLAGRMAARQFIIADTPEDQARFAAKAKKWSEQASRLMPGGAGDGALAFYLAVVEADDVRALNTAENAMRALPNDVEGYHVAGLALRSLGRLEEAADRWSQAKALDIGGVPSWGNHIAVLANLRRKAACEEVMANYQQVKIAVGVGFANETAGVQARFRLDGKLPDSVDTISWPAEKATWLWRLRRFEPLLALCDAQLTAEVKGISRFNWLWRKTDALQRLNRNEEASASAREALTVAQALAAGPKVGLPWDDARLAIAFARLGQGDEAVARARAQIEATPAISLGRRWTREIELAEIYAILSRKAECVELLAKLLRVPSGLTVPMLKVDPVWDNVREDAGFKALLADPKNSAPL